MAHVSTRIDPVSGNKNISKPYFITFNPFYVPSTITFFECDPFPAELFPPHSPFDDHVVVAHHGLEPYARRAGFDDVAAYIQYMIYCSALGLYPDSAGDGYTS